MPCNRPGDCHFVWMRRQEVSTGKKGSSWSEMNLMSHVTLQCCFKRNYLETFSWKGPPKGNIVYVLNSGRAGSMQGWCNSKIVLRNLTMNHAGVWGFGSDSLVSSCYMNILSETKNPFFIYQLYLNHCFQVVQLYNSYERWANIESSFLSILTDIF